LPRHPWAGTGPAGLVLRDLRAEDAVALTDLANLPGYRQNTLRPPFQTVADSRGYIERPSQGGARMAAILDGTLVGTAGLERFQGRRSHVGEIGLGVHDDHVGRGIGTAMLIALLDSADAWLGLVRVQLTVFADNVGAIRLYERNGFVTEGRMRAASLRAGVLEDVLLMARVRAGPVASPHGPTGSP
jgi:putative acetyltransferase